MNKVLLVGRISSTPLMFESKNLKTYARATIAVNREFSKDITDFISLTIFGNTAEYFKKYVNKGDLLSIDGSIQTSNYKNDKGEIVNSFSVVPIAVKHLEPRSIVLARTTSKSNDDYNTAIYEPKANNSNHQQATFSEDENSKDDVPWELDL
ncbi:MAG: single-stranded DNA-binding protein [Mycoplasmataceae bacterium]|nr:single-stranded DNA-binding protein [Mycoplasmataceae bacterium]